MLMLMLCSLASTLAWRLLGFPSALHLNKPFQFSLNRKCSKMVQNGTKLNDKSSRGALDTKMVQNGTKLNKESSRGALGTKMAQNDTKLAKKGPRGLGSHAQSFGLPPSSSRRHCPDQTKPNQTRPDGKHLKLPNVSHQNVLPKIAPRPPKENI